MYELSVRVGGSYQGKKYVWLTSGLIIMAFGAVPLHFQVLARQRTRRYSILMSRILDV